MTNPDSELDNILCRLTTGYTRKELLEFPEEDTGLDKYEVEEELRDVNRAITKLHQWSATRELEARNESFLDKLRESDIFDQQKILGGLIYLYLMRDTGATTAKITLSNFSYKGKPVGDLVVEATLNKELEDL